MRHRETAAYRRGECVLVVTGLGGGLHTGGEVNYFSDAYFGEADQAFRTT